MCLRLSYKKKNMKKIHILKVTEERSRIRIRTKMSRIPNIGKTSSFCARKLSLLMRKSLLKVVMFFSKAPTERLLSKI
jgi:hypothetical protein